MPDGDLATWDGETPLCLIGMSGVGKSFWAHRLQEEEGFLWLDCDGEIAAKLDELVSVEAGEAPVHAVGRWMGMPWHDGYQDRERRYLELEGRVTARAVETIAGRSNARVLDTTGSVVYLDPELLSRIRRETFVVYLRTTERARMLERYLQEPKPVVWGGVFRLDANKSPETALPQCYEQLLTDRDARYRDLAHIVLDAKEVERWQPADFLRHLKRSTPLS